MRPIKFRGLSLETKKWVYGGFMQTPEAAFIVDYSVVVQKARDGYPTVYDVVEVDPETVGQFTGLHAKNGKGIKEIYEGDLLRYPPKDEWEKLNYPAFEVFFHDGDSASTHIGFQMNRIHFYGAICGWGLIQGFVPSHTKKLEVIGNATENPELIEEKKQ